MKFSTTRKLTNSWHAAIGLAMAICCMSQLGCITTAVNTISASRLPLELRGCPQSDLVPINLASLRQEAKEIYTVDAGDVLAVFVPGIVPTQVESVPVIQGNAFLTNIYYPAGGFLKGPAFGIPIAVTEQGMLQLPLAKPLDVRGMTLSEITERVVKRYLDEGMLKDANALAQVSVLNKRVHRVLVIRQDVDLQQVQKSAGTTILSERGSGQVIDLPANENDVLHALSVAGGLPGTDAYNRIWIFRGAGEGTDQTVFQQNLMNAVHSGDWENIAKTYRATCIPMKIRAGEPLPFSPEDVILNTGDVVYVEGHEHQWFYTGGYMPAGQFALPRTEDVDVLEAIAMAQGQIGFEQLGLGLGNFRVPPTQVVIVRKLADGQQFRIRVNLAKATRDASERVLIQPDDLLMVYYKPGQRAGNALFEYSAGFLAEILTNLAP